MRDKAHPLAGRAPDTVRSELRSGVTWLPAAALVVSGLLGCAQKPPPSLPPPARPPIAATSPVVVKAPPAPKSVNLRWSFSAGPNKCQAIATNRGYRLELQVSQGKVMTLSLAGTALSQRRRIAQITFIGDAGTWQLDVRQVTAKSFVGSLPMSEESVGRTLTLLGGGKLRMAGVTGWPTLVLASSGEGGRQWFDCPRQQLASRDATAGHAGFSQ